MGSLRGSRLKGVYTRRSGQVGVGPIECFIELGLPTELTNILSPSFITGWLNVDLVVTPQGSLPARHNEPRKTVEADLIRSIDNAMIMETSVFVPLQYRHDLEAGPVSFEPVAVYGRVQQVREVTEILVSYISRDPFERRMNGR